MPQPFPSSDESLVNPAHPFIGNFHKTLPHDDYGEVLPDAYRKFERTCLAIEGGMPINFEEVPKGPLSHPAQSSFDPQAASALTANVARFTRSLLAIEQPPSPAAVSQLCWLLRRRWRMQQIAVALLQR
jgi:hypothetical protein